MAGNAHQSDEGRGHAGPVAILELAGQIESLPTSSATLVNPKQLEDLLRSQQAANLGQISASYTQVFQPCPRRIRLQLRSGT